MSLSITWAIVVVLLIVSIARMSTFDYNEAINEQERYCQLVGEGTWADYKRIYKEQCHEPIQSR